MYATSNIMRSLQMTSILIGWKHIRSFPWPFEDAFKSNIIAADGYYHSETGE
jgi:hypothetical protein